VHSVPYYRLEVALKTGGPVCVNGFWGAHLRSALGVALRESCCPFPGAPCDGCLLRFDCAFATAWHTFVHPDDEESGLPPGVTTNRSHPFILRAAKKTPDKVAAGRIIKFGMTILGEHTYKTAFWIVALKRMAARGLGKGTAPLELVQVKRLLGKRSRILYDKSKRAVGRPGEPDMLRIGELPARADSNRLVDLKLKFVSPLRLRRKDEEPAAPTPRLIWEAAVRRIQGMASANGARPPEGWGGEYYSEEVSGCWSRIKQDRWSSSQKQRIPATGFAGEIEIADAPLGHVPWWNAAQLLGIGKMAAFGLGAFELEVKGGEDSGGR
ncbi:MAG: CRISPR system precrRNA processing endoribonuclease RAMP protein Cas6, partial [bacterium]|jgi:hypothetical protein